MYPSVAPAFWQVTKDLEGVVRAPYVDNKNLVTAAVGYLVDNGSGVAPPEMLALPWHYVTPGSLNTNDVIVGMPFATVAQIQDGWRRVKNSGLAGIGGGSAKFLALTNLRLDDAGMAGATAKWVAQNEPNLKRSFPRYPTMQADGQLGILLLAYALGSAFAPKFPKFAAAINAFVPDYRTAQAEGVISAQNNPQIADRDQDIHILFGNAAAAQAENVPNDVLWWPGTSPPSGSGGSGPRGGGSLAIAPRGRERTSILGKVVRGAILIGGGALGVFAVRGFVRHDPWTRRPAALARRLMRSEDKLERRVDRAVLGEGKS